MVGAVGGVATTGGCDSFDTAPADGGVEGRDAGALADAAGPDGAGPAVDGGDAGPAFQACPNGTRVFVTSRTYPASFGKGGDPKGVANAICTALAKDAKLGGRYEAWLAAGLATVGPRATLPASTLGFVSTDCKVVFATSARDFENSLLASPIDRIEDGRNTDALGAPGDVHTVWTGAVANGTSTGANCSDWNVVSGPPPTTGDLKQTGPAWTTGAGGTCASVGRFYCFEVLP